MVVFEISGSALACIVGMAQRSSKLCRRGIVEHAVGAIIHALEMGRARLYDSSMNQTVLRIAAWSLLLFVAAATLSPIGLRPNLPMNVDLERALAFLALGLVFALAYPRQLWVGAAIVLLGAFGLEVLQELRPDRHGRGADALVKAGAACIGLGLGWLALKPGKRRASSVARR